MLVIVQAKGVPPGGYSFADKRTGRQFGGFSQDFNGRVREIVEHRLANPSIYPQHESQHFSFTAVARELTDSICQKHPSFCMETVPVGPATSVAPAVVQPPPNPACPKCGSMEFEARYCPTCSGQKLIGWKCKKCGAERGR